MFCGEGAGGIGCGRYGGFPPGGGGGAGALATPYRYEYFPAKMMTPNTAADEMVQGFNTSTPDWKQDIIQFQSGQDNPVWWTWVPPEYIDFTAPIRVKPYLFKNNGNTGITRFEFAVCSFEPSEPYYTGTGTPFSSLTQAVQQDQAIWDSRVGDGTNVDACAICNVIAANSYNENCLLGFEMRRDNSVGGNLGNDVRLIGVHIQYIIDTTATPGLWPAAVTS